MPGDRIAVDGLWRCLCPSIDIVSLSKPFNLWHIPRARPAPALAHRSALSRSPQQQCQRQCRRQHGQAAPLPDHTARLHRASGGTRVAYLRRLSKRNPWIPGTVFHGLDSFSAKLDSIPTRTLYAALNELQGADKTYIPLTRLVEYLVKERGERPNATLYESLIRANVDKHYGSAKAAAQLLKEAQSHNIPTTLEMCQSLLDVTAVHPDYVLRAQVLHDMRNRWYSLTPNSEVSIVLGLLRDGQYELALCKLEELNKIPVNVPPWVFDVFLYTFGDLGFYEETLAILRHRLRVVNAVKRAPLSPNAWLYLLDVFSRDAFQPGIKFIWEHSVAPHHIHPPDGVIANVLNAASAHGDTALVISAAQELSARGTKLSMHHYEALIHVHIQHEDLRKALTVLCIMAKAGFTPDLSSTRPIFSMLRDSLASMKKALEILHELKAQYTIPPAAFNVILESTAAHGGFRIAFDLYRTIRQVCINGPDLETFDILLQHCTQRKSMNFLVAEMEAFSLKPSKCILDHLVRICSLQDDYGMAFRFLEMMRAGTPPDSAETWWISRNTALALLRKCIQNQDPRSRGIFEECRHRRLFDEGDVKSLMSVGAGTPQNQSSCSGSFDQTRLESASHPLLNSMSA
ncbi:hypothetical protein F5B17DRAFT_386081 [Nemania serpens]|nr:hypothetical protein F5B17DRAFT_386081 [Nemania serpens]